MRNINFTLFTLSAVEVLRLDVILKVGDRENYPDANPTSVRAREMQTTKHALLVPKFTCQRYLITALDIHNLWVISMPEGSATEMLSHLPCPALLERGQGFRLLDLSSILLVFELLGQLLGQSQVGCMGRLARKLRGGETAHTNHRPSPERKQKTSEWPEARSER